MPKGSKAALWNLAFYTGGRRGDVRRPYVFAQMQLTRFRPVRGVWQAHCFHGLMRTAVPSKIVSSTVPLAPHPKGTSYGDAEASPSGRSTQRQGDKRQRRSRLNRVKCTVAKRQAQSTSEWPKTLLRGFKGPQPLDTPFSPIFRRASKDGVPEGRWKSRAVGKKRTAKDIATGGRNEKIAPRKTAQSQFCHKTKSTNAGNSYVGAFPYGSASLRREVI